MGAEPPEGYKLQPPAGGRGGAFATPAQ